MANVQLKPSAIETEITDGNWRVNCLFPLSLSDRSGRREGIAVGDTASSPRPLCDAADDGHRTHRRFADCGTGQAEPRYRSAWRTGETTRASSEEFISGCKCTGCCGSREETLCQRGGTPQDGAGAEKTVGGEKCWAKDIVFLHHRVSLLVTHSPPSSFLLIRSPR